VLELQRGAGVFRYVAIAWNASDPRQTEAARRVARRLRLTSPELLLSLGTRGLLVFHANARPESSEALLLPNTGGVVLGKLFDRELDAHAAPRKVVLDGGAASAILDTGGRHLIEHYWGRYVAFLRQETTRTTWVLRDPTGCLPCFVTTYRDVDIFFSSMDDCIRLGFLRFSINWKYVAALVAYPALQVRDTGLNEVSEVQAGECIEFRDGAAGKRTLYWDPVRIAQANPIEDFDAAASALRRTTGMCVAAWASCYPRIIHTLSGGLDSSIVLSCLRYAPGRPQVTCVNYFDPSTEGDERHYARLAARAAGCELIECERDVSAVRLEAILDIARSARPWFYTYYVTHSPIETRWAHEKEASAIFGGGSGDQVFCSGASRLAAVDYVHRHGIGRDLWRIALDAARAQHLSIWPVLYSATRGGLFKQPCDPLSEVGIYRELVNPEIIETARRDQRLVLPWLADAKGVAPGKLRHLLSMSVAPSFYNPLGRPNDPETVHPLFSQPLIELSIRIPTYVLGAGGANRALARRAFAHDVPSPIISRRGKGGMTHFATDLLRRNERFVRELLLDGHLVRAKLIQRHKLEQLLSTKYSALTPGVVEIIEDHLSLEAWLRSWTRIRQRAVSAA